MKLFKKIRRHVEFIGLTFQLFERSTSKRMPALAQDKMSNVDSLKSIFKQHQQDQVFQFWNQLSPEKQESLLQQLRQIDPERVNQIFTQTMLKAKQLEQGGKLSL